MTVERRGEGRLIFSSLASRTAAIIEAEIARVEAKRSRRRFSSSRAFALFISPMPVIIGEEKANIANKIKPPAGTARSGGSLHNHHLLFPVKSENQGNNSLHNHCNRSEQRGYTLQRGAAVCILHLVLSPICTALRFSLQRSFCLVEPLLRQARVCRSYRRTRRGWMTRKSQISY